MKKEERLIKIKKSPAFYKHHMINIDDVIKHGIEKACIMGNFDRMEGLDRDEWYTSFPYIEKSMFYKLLEELISDRILAET